MGKTFSMMVAAAAVLVASEGHAQFANRSLGAGLGFVKLLGGGATTQVGVDFALPLSLEGTFYIENGFDLYLHVPLMLVSVTSGAGTPSGRGLVFGTGGHLGVRYLFSEESLRPYVGVELAGFVLLLSGSQVVFVGPGISGGVDYFVADTLSLGVRSFFDVFIELNQSPRPAFGAGIAASAYF